MKEPEYKMDRLDVMIRTLQRENADLHSDIRQIQAERDADSRMMILAELLLFLLGIAIGAGLMAMFK